MRNLVKAAATVALVVSAMATVGTTSALAADEVHGCPSGAVCLYPEDAGFNNDRPSHVFFSIGVHRVENQFGMHVLLNNQVRGAKAQTCLDTGGNNCQGILEAGTHNEPNMDRINSIRLLAGDVPGGR